MGKLNYILLIAILNIVIGCSKADGFDIKDNKDINIFSKHAFISDYVQVNQRVLEFIELGFLDLNSNSEIFTNTWVHSFHYKKRWPNVLDIEIEEHQPFARLSNSNYLTHSGHIIFPEKTDITIDVLHIDAPDDETLEILYLSRDLQSLFNKLKRKLEKMESKNNGLIEVTDDKGATFVFSKKDFRVQLERLEQLILFELNSGKIDHNRYIDLRYKNAIAVSRKKMEKRI